MENLRHVKDTRFGPGQRKTLSQRVYVLLPYPHFDGVTRVTPTSQFKVVMSCPTVPPHRVHVYHFFGGIEPVYDSLWCILSVRITGTGPYEFPGTQTWFFSCTTTQGGSDTGVHVMCSLGVRSNQSTSVETRRV